MMYVYFYILSTTLRHHQLLPISKKEEKMKTIHRGVSSLSSSSSENNIKQNIEIDKSIHTRTSS